MAAETSSEAGAQARSVALHINDGNEKDTSLPLTLPSGDGLSDTGSWEYKAGATGAGVDATDFRRLTLLHLLSSTPYREAFITAKCVSFLDMGWPKIYLSFYKPQDCAKHIQQLVAAALRSDTEHVVAHLEDSPTTSVHFAPNIFKHTRDIELSIARKIDAMDSKNTRSFPVPARVVVITSEHSLSGSQPGLALIRLQLDRWKHTGTEAQAQAGAGDGLDAISTVGFLNVTSVTAQDRFSEMVSGALGVTRVFVKRYSRDHKDGVHTVESLMVASKAASPIFFVHLGRLCSQHHLVPVAKSAERFRNNVAVFTFHFVLHGQVEQKALEVLQGQVYGLFKVRVPRDGSSGVIGAVTAAKTQTSESDPPLLTAGASMSDTLPPLMLHPPAEQKESKVTASPKATDTMPRPRLTRAGTLVQGIAKRPENSRQLYYSLLVHTVSHADMLLSFKAGDGSDSIGKPKFSSFLSVSETVLAHLRSEEAGTGASAGSSHAEPVYMDRQVGNMQKQPVGYRFGRPLEMASAEAWDTVKLKGTEYRKKFEHPVVSGVYFPLLAVILPRWMELCDERRRGHSGPGLRWLYLVSGSGTPWNSEHSASGNSTEGVALLIAEFVRTFFPEIKVILVHSGTEIFHYDENVRFVNTNLKPLIEDVRRELAENVYEDWVNRLSLTLSISAGAPARVAAITAALREFRPNSLHMWQLKTFWHSFPLQTVLNDSDVEYHSFEKLETTPPVDISHLPSRVQLLIQEMRKHKQAFETVRDSGRYHELGKFWLRKSKKPVLCVLMVMKKGALTATFFRGINSEVSLPTGSLCAERNAVSSALASDLTLVRQDLKMIAVLAVPLSVGSSASTTPVIAYRSVSDAAHRGELGTLPSVTESRPGVEPSGQDTFELPPPLFQDETVGGLPSMLATDMGSEAPIVPTPSSSAARPTFHQERPEQERRNPIAPCGACNEWLRKIHEVNPDFKIVTFPDLSLDSAFVRGVH